MTVLSCCDVSHCYGAVQALEGASISVEAGNVLCLVGPNGAGKSTLLRVLAGLLMPDCGEVAIDGRRVASLPARERARSIAFLAQENSCAFPFTAREVILMGRLPHVGAFSFESDADRLAVDRAIEETGLEKLVDRPIDHLSAGERQRVFLAMALAQEPRVLLLDEPTVYLDVKHQMETFRLLARLSRERALAVGLVTHDLALAARFSDRMALLSAGRVVRQGTPSEVMDAAALSGAYGTALEVVTLPDGGLAIVPTSPFALRASGDDSPERK